MFVKIQGTAGVWRIAAIDEAGGWKDRTTVEDMDLAVRASLKGWKFLYLGSLKVKFILQQMEQDMFSSKNRFLFFQAYEFITLGKPVYAALFYGSNKMI